MVAHDDGDQGWREVGRLGSRDIRNLDIRGGGSLMNLEDARKRVPPGYHSGMQNMIQLLVAADHPAVGAALMALLAAEQDIEVSGVAGTDRKLVDLAEEFQVDMVLMDLRFGDGRRWATTIRELRELPHDPYVLVLAEDGQVVAGASGYLPEQTPTWEIPAAVRTAFEERALAPPPLATRARASARQVSQRELEILQLVSQGKTNRQISEALSLSESTVKSHLGHAYVKLDVASRTAAVARARGRGLIA